MKKSGFTLLELMIVLSIMAILLTLAYSSYEDSVRKARRADAQTDLIEFGNVAERFFTQNPATGYAGADADNNNKPDSALDTDFYVYTLAVAATTYTITATPTAIQNKDGCGTMTLNQAGVRTKTGTETGCW